MLGASHLQFILRIPEDWNPQMSSWAFTWLAVLRTMFMKIFALKNMWLFLIRAYEKDLLKIFPGTEILPLENRLKYK